MSGTGWNVGATANGLLSPDKEKAVLVGVITSQQSEAQVMEYMDELEFLAETAGAETLRRFTQKLPQPDSRTFIGKGKLEEIAEYVELKEINLVIFDDDLSGKQVNLLETALKVKIVDRSSLILDIFANRAQTAQAKTQVELAQMQYLLPRLRGLWTHLERQRGGIGMRGPGEKEIETDRRIVRDKISQLKKELEKIERQNQTQRKNRGAMVRVALVGYTNVGKSTLMNLMSKSDVFAENKLFATLDTTVRKVVWEAMPFLLSDTVGFIRKLPHHLVESFKSTLDEVRESDLLIHVIDIAHPQYEDHLKTVTQTLNELKVGEKDVFYVFNKLDAYRDAYFDERLEPETQKEIEEELFQSLVSQYGDDIALVSAQTGEGISDLRNRLASRIKEIYRIRYPYQAKLW
ncbi:MAG: GTPase HflX [Saprospiraceae bacterium]|nr:GTPase HflX [Saprospiraceae bacterium]